MKIRDIERDLKKETHEVNQINAKLEQDLVKKTESFDQLMDSLEKFKEENKNQSQVQNISTEMDERFEIDKRGKMLCKYLVNFKKCPFASCPFAHSITEVKKANKNPYGGTFYKSAPCKVCNY